MLYAFWKYVLLLLPRTWYWPQSKLAQNSLQQKIFQILNISTNSTISGCFVFGRNVNIDNLSAKPIHAIPPAHLFHVLIKSIICLNLVLWFKYYKNLQPNYDCCDRCSISSLTIKSYKELEWSQFKWRCKVLYGPASIYALYAKDWIQQKSDNLPRPKSHNA